MSVTPFLPQIPIIDFAHVDPEHAGLSYEERLLEAMTPRMRVLLSIGRAAYKAKQAETGDTGTCGFASVIFQITEATKPTLRWLFEELKSPFEITFDPWKLDCGVCSIALLDDGDVPATSLAVQAAGCRAFASALMSVGVPCRVITKVD